MRLLYYVSKVKMLFRTNYLTMDLTIQIIEFAIMVCVYRWEEPMNYNDCHPLQRQQVKVWNIEHLQN